MIGSSSRSDLEDLFAFREPSVLPVDLGATRSTGISAIAYERLRRYLGLPERPTRVFDVRQYLACVDEDVRSWAHASFQPLYPMRVSAGLSIASWREASMPRLERCMVPAEYAPEEQDDGASVLRDSAGDITHRRPADGLYYEDALHPFEHVSDPSFFDRLGVGRPGVAEVEWLRAQSKLLRATGQPVVATTPFSFFERGIKDFGYEHWLVLLMTEPVLVDAYEEWLLRSYVSYVDAHHDALKTSADVVLFTDDLGTQMGMLIPPRTYRERIMPRHRSLIAHLKNGCPHLKTLLHSCGAVREVLPDLIQTGFDAINPVQYTAAGMSPQDLKREFGRDIVFWGGGVDTQYTLVHGTTQAVRDEARRQVDVLAPGGGFVFAAVHNIQADVPPENAAALFDAVRGH